MQKPDENELVEKVLAQVLRNNVVDNKQKVGVSRLSSSINGVTEFIGIAPIGDTIGMAIANVDPELLKNLHVEHPYRSIGILSARTGGGPQIMSMDEAVKGTNTEAISVQMPRDTKGGAGHGSLILVGGDDVSDVRQAVNIALENVPKHFGDVYNTPAGHLELQYTARASQVCNLAFGAPEGKAYGLIAGAPAGIGVVMADVAMKAANVDALSFASPAHGTSFSNEGILHISGESGAVRQAVLSAREVGIKLLTQLGGTPTNDYPSYI
ncbi:propanediol utilization microcompartment protein PduB [Companilactobacillus ginsenosidimutans]|uniref:propanediol utilization microcompartment protein PduB n=1 Tax=Companilactobacillus ginsenosidimutans TaxID=1007676 RepID=UPI000A010BF8|nr:propanediol utilization microcompartment protein PduB [Companilactobacillus ginsenosidimutans]